MRKSCSSKVMEGLRDVHGDLTSAAAGQNAKFTAPKPSSHESTSARYNDFRFGDDHEEFDCGGRELQPKMLKKSRLRKPRLYKKTGSKVMEGHRKNNWQSKISQKSRLKKPGLYKKTRPMVIVDFDSTTSASPVDPVRRTKLFTAYPL